MAIRKDPSQVTFETADWLYVMEWVEKALSNGRDSLENKNLDPIETAWTRGRVAVLKELKNLPKVAIINLSHKQD